MHIAPGQLCEHCNISPAIIKFPSGKYCCQRSASKCPANREKNARGLKLAYANGTKISPKIYYEGLPQETKDRMAWSKGVFRTNSRESIISSRGYQCEECRNFGVAK